MRLTCSKKGCGRPTFMDEDRCFNHAAEPSTGVKVVGALMFLVGLAISLAIIGVGIWALIELVTWVTSR